MPSFFDLKKRVAFVVYGTILTSAILAIGVTSTIAHFEVARAQTQPDFNAPSVYDSGQMNLGNNVKHLVIVIPNEGIMGQVKKMKRGSLLNLLFHKMPQWALELRLSGLMEM